MQRKLLWLLGAVAIGLVADFRPAQAQGDPPPGEDGPCWQCTTWTDMQGFEHCKTSKQATGYQICSCPCDCTISCPPNDGFVFSYDQLLNQKTIDIKGVPVNHVPTWALTRRAYSEQKGAVAFVTDRFGLVQYEEDKWRAFPLESSGVFSKRNCSGMFLARFRAAD